MSEAAVDGLRELDGDGGEVVADLELLRLLGDGARRVQHGRELPQDLLGRVAQQALRTGVEERDPPDLVGADDRDVGAADDLLDLVPLDPELPSLEHLLSHDDRERRADEAARQEEDLQQDPGRVVGQGVGVRCLRQRPEPERGEEGADRGHHHQLPLDLGQRQPPGTPARASASRGRASAGKWSGRNTSVVTDAVDAPTASNRSERPGDGAVLVGLHEEREQEERRGHVPHEGAEGDEAEGPRLERAERHHGDRGRGRPRRARSRRRSG